MRTVPRTLDTFIARLLLVRPKAQEAVQQPPPDAERAFNISLVFTAIRCIIQYVILPFVLPIIGVAGNVAVQISLVINVVAIVAIIFSVRRFWQVDYKGKWNYLIIAIFALLFLAVFLYVDLQKIGLIGA
jgi:hypothetical protein